LLAQAEVGRGIASRKGGVQNRAKLAEERLPFPSLT